MKLTVKIELSPDEVNEALAASVEESTKYSSDFKSWHYAGPKIEFTTSGGVVLTYCEKPPEADPVVPAIEPEPQAV